MRRLELRLTAHTVYRLVTVALASALVLSACAVSSTPAPASAWDPGAFSDEGTLQFLTVGPDEGEHWSRVWLAVIDNRLYVRLGSQAAARIRNNTTAPYVKVRIAGQEFDKVKMVPANDMADKVAAAMADKYWLDFVVRGARHQMTARLVAESSAPTG